MLKKDDDNRLRVFEMKCYGSLLGMKCYGRLSGMFPLCDERGDQTSCPNGR